MNPILKAHLDGLHGVLRERSEARRVLADFVEENKVIFDLEAELESNIQAQDTKIEVFLSRLYKVECEGCGHETYGYVTVDEEWLFASTEEIEREFGESLQELREKMEHATTPVCEVCCPYP